MKSPATSRTLSQTLIALGVALLCATSFAQASVQQTNNMDARRDEPRREPPPQAFEACKTKKVNDVVEITTPRGDKMKGTCVESAKGLFARPEHPPRPPRENGEEGKDRRPPPKQAREGEK
ncbi:hypothetical protein RF679_02370 [Undibacterium cyanobacteriorum]|uniref:Uncharacterized protein n=1 Tax=Undibacterium cyanobacteriorum TaxID=3073561 RepID=A0ABY9RIV1_9BURK|nr:hypothetical protein [Undibacterium sp. 20NA77.5]WMW81140.1 hypothetical protein RF679_02370 [Undibacterium sp. 20NA77.5]